MQGIVDFLFDCVYWLYALVIAAVNSVVQMLLDVFCMIVDQLLAVVVYLLELIDLSDFAGFNLTEWINKLPPDALNVISLVGLPQASVMVISALIIRLFMQLIPFTRLGS